LTLDEFTPFPINNIIIADNITATQNMNFTLKAVQLYEITYRGNGNTGETAPINQYKTYDMDYVVLANILTKDGYIANGWDNYVDGTVYSINAPLLLLANYIEISSDIFQIIWKQPTITIGAEIVGDKDIMNYDSIFAATPKESFAIVTAPIYAPPIISSDQYIYTFAGWNLTQQVEFNDNQTYITDFGVATVNQVYYAWYMRTIRKYTVTFTVANVSTIVRENIEYGTLVKNLFPTDTEVQGRILEVQGYAVNMKVTERCIFNIVLSTTNETVTINFFDEKGMIIQSSVVAKGAASYLVEAPVIDEYDGWSFIGWNNNFNEHTVFNQDIAFTVSWVKSNSTSIKDEQSLSVSPLAYVFASIGGVGLITSLIIIIKISHTLFVAHAASSKMKIMRNTGDM
jgi:hypothetical protein